MAVSIGHEIRNPMTTIRGYIQLLQRRGKLIEYDDTFNVMLDEIDRADSIIKRFLTLAKNKRFDFHPCDLNSIIFSLKPLLEAEALWRGCRLRVEAGDIPVILADEDAIGQVIINLARNGLEAMQQGGELTIKTYRYCDNLILEVKDTGHGIAENLLDKIWKPFFTTKENGTGLGLPVCYRIVEQHGALLEIQSSSEGTSIKAKFNL
jgi:signal transduction histidine kinase